MSVQNLREKFNQPVNGTVSPPGTSFGSLKSQPTTKPETFLHKTESSTLKTSPFGPSINGKKPTHFRSLSSNKSSSPSPDRLLNSSPKPFVNNCVNHKSRMKSPEQSQQDIILRKWNSDSTSPEVSNNIPVRDKISNNSETTVPWAHNSNESCKPKSVISRYISQLTVDASGNNCDTSCENGEKPKNKCEVNSTKNGTSKRENFTNSPQSSFISANRGNSSFLNNIRTKMNGNGAISNGCANVFSACDSLRKTELSDKWKSNSQNKAEVEATPTSLVQVPTKDYSALERKYHGLQQDHEKLKREFREKTDQLNQLRKLSEGMYKEYDQLRNQYKLETSTMHQAMERATQWYKQNRELKRQSTALLQHVIAMRPDAISEMGDEVDTYSDHDNEIEALRKTIQELTKDMSKLQAELNSVKTKENEAQERISYLSMQLDAERRAKLSAESLKQKERRATSATINEFDSVEDKLRATEDELHLALERANQAEAETRALSDKVSELENELQDFKNKTTMELSAPPAPPPPPPPPPPPSLGTSNISNVVLRKSTVRADQTEDSAAEQMADLLGIHKKSGIPKVQGGAIDDIINEIKGGRFTLKATEKQNGTKKEEPPPVVHEMMNVLGTLRRQPNRKRDCSTERSVDK